MRHAAQVLAANDPVPFAKQSAAVEALRLSVGALLLVTGFLKLFYPPQSASLEVVYDLPRWIILTVSQIEILVGLLLIFRVHVRLAWSLATGVFVLFTLFSLYRGVAGFESCGCFGPITVNPWWTFLIDSAILALLVFCHPRFFARRVKPRHTIAPIIGYSLIGVPSLLYVLFVSPPLTSSDAFSWRADELVILDPQEWIGHEFPLKGFLSPEMNVTHSEWVVLIYHHDCPDCQKALAEYVELADELSSSGNTTRVLLLEVPPYRQEIHPAAPVEHARLATDKDWFIQTPVELRLNDGTVVQVSSSLPSIQTTQ